jgi:NADH-quinone oxidoreductase subunit J
MTEVGLQIVFWFFAAVAVLGGLGVVIFREPIKSVLSLVGTMLSLAVLFLLLSAQFIFVVQIIVYAGAVMVLFLFVVALLGPMKERRTKRLRFHWTLSVLAGLVFIGFLVAMLQGIQYRTPQPADMSVFGTVEQIGAGLFGPYLFPFELTSVLLVVAAVGAIYLSRGGRPSPSPPAGEGRVGGHGAISTRTEKGRDSSQTHEEEIVVGPVRSGGDSSAHPQIDLYRETHNAD